MATLQEKQTGDTVFATDWNGVVDQINANTTAIATETTNRTNAVSSEASTRASADALKADKSTTITTASGSGLTGGGDLSANRSLAVSYGTAAGTAAQGNDSRINNGQTAYTTTTNSTYGNTALNTRVSSLESQVGTADAVFVTRTVSAATNTFTQGLDLPFDNTMTENKGGWTVSGGALYVPVNGVYQFTMQAVFESPATAGAIGTLGCYVTLNGSGGAAYGVSANERASAPNQTVMQCTGMHRFAKGDYIVGRIFSNSSSATTYRGTSHTNSYGGTYLSVLKVAD